MNGDGSASRVLLRHSKLIVAAVLLCVGVEFALTSGHHPSYTAKARVMVASQAPTSTQAADAATSEARALATSNSLLAKAISSANVDRVPDAVARHVSLQELGTSQIATLSVSDSDPAVATVLTSALAKQLIAAINAAADGGLPGVLQQLDSQLTALTGQRAAVSAQLAKQPTGATALQLTALAAGLDREIQDLGVQRNQLLSDAAARPRADVVDLPAGPAPKNSSHRTADLALALLLGLIVGATAAGISEVARPVVPDAKRLSSLTDAPVVGVLSYRKDAFVPSEVAAMRRVVTLAAANAEVSRVVLLGPVAEPVLHLLAKQLDNEVLPSWQPEPSPASVVAGPQRSVNGNDAPQWSPRRLAVRTLATVDGSSHEGTGTVVVAWAGVAQRRLASVDDFVRAAGWPVVGVSVIRRGSLLRRAGSAVTRARANRRARKGIAAGEGVAG